MRRKTTETTTQRTGRVRRMRRRGFQREGAMLLEEVFGGNDADCRSELVDDDGDVAAALLKLLEEFDGELGLRDHGDLAHDLAEGEA
jgi:hypothetical protein